jgi:hypothetical protein
MFVTKLTIAGSVLLAATLVGAGAGLLAYHALPARAGEARSAIRATATAQDNAKKDDKDDEEADRLASAQNLKQILLAMHNYHDVHGHFPPAASHDANGKALLSWRVLILPWLAEEELYKEFKLDEPWDSEHNKKLLAKMPSLYAPVRGKDKKEHVTHYQVFTGKGTIFEGTEGIPIRDITDGTSNTIAVVEGADTVPWTKPADLAYDAEKPLPKLGGMFKDVFNAAFADGSVHALKREFDEATMRLVITRNDGQLIDFSKIR